VYVSIAELREEGVTESDASDARLERLIALAERTIENVTGRFFEPRIQVITLDGSGTSGLRLPQPVIAIDWVATDPAPGRLAEALLEPTRYRVFNRHIATGLFAPDDREDPRLELVGDAVWPLGRQNIVVRGWFGYTDPDGSPLGRTPAPIRQATMLLVLRELPRLVDVDARAESRNRGRIVSERTRDQAYTLQALASVGAFTGDSEIDGLLVRYLRPPDLGAA
jgi:hypothetical protein